MSRWPGGQTAEIFKGFAVAYDTYVGRSTLQEGTYEYNEANKKWELQN